MCAMKTREEIRLGEVKWLNLTNPVEADIKYIGKKFGFHHLDLEDVVSETQRAKIDEYPDYLFILLHFPKINKRTRRLQSEEVDIFLMKNQLVTVHDNLPMLTKTFNACQKNKKLKEEYMDNSAGFLLYKILDALFDSCFEFLENMYKTLNQLEKEVFEYEFHRDNLRDILLLKKDMINFRRIIIPQRGVVAQLEHKTPGDLDVYFDDIVDKIEKIWSMLENMKELIESLHETNETIISHNTNNVIKVLTVFSAVMLPLTVITGFYGMNLVLPYANDPYASAYVAGGMLLLVAAMLAFLRYKRWI